MKPDHPRFRCGRSVMANLAVRTGVFAALGVLALPARGAQATRGEAVQVDWRVAYERQVGGSPFKPGGPWHPLCPGKWRLVACIDGVHHTVPATVTVAQAASTSLRFDSPATGKLECVLFYLHGRTPETPKEIVTPFDICREVRGE